jgi:hypothetical protein
MKKVLYYISILCVLTFTGCIDREILDSKPGEEIDPVTNLKYTISGTDVTLTWNLPTTIPDDIIKPVSIYVKVLRNNVSIASVVLPNAPLTYVYKPYDSTKQYIIIVKVQGSVDTTDPNVSNLRYSLGASVSF